MDNAKNPKFDQYIDDAMILIKKENTSLKGVLDKDAPDLSLIRVDSMSL